MNTYAKGSRIEKLLDDWLKERDFVTHRARKNVIMKINPKTRKPFYFAARNDIFGCFDIVAKSKTFRQNTYFFQVSTDWKYGKSREEIEAFPYGPNDCVIMARKEPRKEFQFLLQSGNNWTPIEWVPEHGYFLPRTAK